MLSKLDLSQNVPIPVKGVTPTQPQSYPKPFALNEEGRLPVAPDLTNIKMSLADFGKLIKSKYPAYSEMPDEEIGQKMIDKFPVYADKIAQPEEQPGFFKSLGRAIVEPFARIAGTAKIALGGGIEKNQETDEYGYDANGNYVGVMKSSGINVPALGKFQPVGYDEGGQMKSGAGIAADLLGNSIQGGLMFAPATEGAKIGEAAIAKTLGRYAPKAAEKAIGFGSKLLPRALEAGGMGVGFQVGSNLSKERPLLENVGTAAALGAAFPIAGTALGVASKKLLSKSESLRGGVAERMVNSLIKPLSKDFAYGKNPGRGVAAEGIVANNLEELGAKISERRQAVGAAKGNFLRNEKFDGIKIDTQGALAPINEALKEARLTPNTNQALITRLEGLRADMEGLGVGQTHDLVTTDALKQKIGQLTKWTGNASDDKAINSALRKSYGTLMGKIENIAPEIKPLNERFGDLLSAEIATKYRDVIAQRLNLISLGGKLTGIGGAIVAVLSTGGTALPALLAGAGVGAITEALGTPAVKTRVAAWLMKATTAEKNKVFAQIPTLKNALERVFGENELTKISNPKIAPAEKFNLEWFKNADGGIEEDMLKNWMKENNFFGTIQGVSNLEAKPNVLKGSTPLIERVGSSNAFPDEGMERAYEVYKKMSKQYKEFDLLDESGMYAKFNGTKNAANYKTIFDPVAGGGEYGMTADDLLNLFRERLKKEQTPLKSSNPAIPF